MIRSGIVTAAVAALVLCTGIAGAYAYEQFNNASVGLKNGKTSDLGALASAYCSSKGFKGAERFQFSGFVANGGKVNAKFATVHCTMVANVRPRGGTIRAGKFTPDYGSAVSHGISKEIANRQTVLDSLDKQFGGGSSSNGSGGGISAGSSSVGSLCCK